MFRTEPRAGVTNFEANYLAAVDFYDAGFSRGATRPRPPSGLNLEPWIALVVLNQSEFTRGQEHCQPSAAVHHHHRRERPAAVPADLWAWAHVHFNEGLSAQPAHELVSTDMSAVIPLVQSILSTNPDLAYSRLLCRACSMSTPATTRSSSRLSRAAASPDSGEDPTKTPSALASAWASYASQQEPQNFPYYYRWHFRTGDRGDFRYLVSSAHAAAG